MRTWRFREVEMKTEAKKLAAKDVRRNKGGVKSGVKAGYAPYGKVKPVPA